MSTAAAQGVLDQFVEEVADLEYGQLPGDVVELASQCFLDVAGCAIAGASEPAAAIVRSVTDDLALSLGVAAHALDFDDWAPRSGAHPSAAIVPALLAALDARERPCSGQEMIRAFVAAYEFQERLGIAISPSHYDIGFHTTGIVGTFGAAAGSALLLGADAAEITTAVKIAATEAAGLKSVFGSMGKPLNAGRAAQAGLLAARLAVAGFQGPAADTVFGAQGFGPTHSTEVDLDPVRRPFAEEWLIRSHLFKYYPSCFGTHAAIMAAESLRRTPALSPQSVVSIDLTVPTIVMPVCAIPLPATGLEGKFSIAYCTAAALEGEVGTATFTDPLPMSEEVARLVKSVRLHVDDSFAKTRTILELRLNDGVRLVEDADAGRPTWSSDPHESRPLLLRKFRELTVPVLGADSAENLAARLLGLADESEVGPDLLSAGDSEMNAMLQ